MKFESFARDCLPDPPTPRSKAFPEGCLKTHEILEIWSQASKNMTNLIGDFVCEL